MPEGHVFHVKVAYTGRPGVHLDGDGTTEGWFRSDDPSGDGGFVTTEPVGTEDWMPLNNHPSAKPTYDFHDTVNRSRTAIANGRLLSVHTHPHDSRFPHGSRTFHWRSGAPVASYLVESSVGHFDLRSRRGSDGVRYYEAQGSSLSPARKQANLKVMGRQQDITDFQSRFNGPFPFRTDGVLVGVPSASFEEEMQTMITFAGGRIDLDTFNHENMHQWWGDNVSEGNFDLTFFKEGMATLGEYLFHAREARAAAGGRHTAAGPEGVPAQPEPGVRRQLPQLREHLGVRTLRPDARAPVLRQHDVHPAGHGVRRTAADPRARAIRPGAAADPARLRRPQHHRAAARGGVRPVPAPAHPRLPTAAGPLLHAVVRHGVPRAGATPGPGSRVPAWPAPASTAAGCR